MLKKVTFKILQGRLHQYINQELLDVQVGFRKGKGDIDQTVNIHWTIKKVREFQKNTYFYFTDHTEASNCVDHNKLKNSERDGNSRPPYQFPEKPVCGARSNS